MSIFKRLGQCLMLAVLVAFTTASTDTAVRFSDLGHKMMCVCGCNQVLIECNHVGCPDSERMLGELRTAISHGDSDTTILEAFQAKYGPTVLAAPMLTRFNKAVWFVPPLVLLLGILGTVLLVRKWRMQTVPMPEDPASPDFKTMRDRIRRETEL